MVVMSSPSPITYNPMCLPTAWIRPIKPPSGIERIPLKAYKMEVFGMLPYLQDINDFFSARIYESVALTRVGKFQEILGYPSDRYMP